MRNAMVSFTNDTVQGVTDVRIKKNDAKMAHPGDSVARIPF